MGKIYVVNGKEVIIVNKETFNGGLIEVQDIKSGTHFGVDAKSLKEK